MSIDFNNKGNFSFNKTDSIQLSDVVEKEKGGCTLYDKIWNRKYLIGIFLAFCFWRNRYYSTKLEFPVSESLKKGNNFTVMQFNKSNANQNL